MNIYDIDDVYDDEENVKYLSGKQQIDLIKDKIECNSYPPSFNESLKKGFYDGIHIKNCNANCFSYALDVCDTNLILTASTYFGTLGRKGRYKDYIACGRRKLLRYLYDSFNLFDLRIRNSSFEEELNIDETKILLGVKRYDFHFIRKDKEGSWSHVITWGSKPEKVCDINENPANYLADVLKYKVVGFFAYRKTLFVG